MDTALATQAYLLYVLLPIWVLVGFADWLCHRAARIENTSGYKESFIHLLMLAEVGLPLLMALFLEINALVILIMVAFFLAHEVTAHWDLSYASRRREVTPTEQHVHNYLGALPFMALSFILVLHWPQVLSLFGYGSEPLRLSLTLKQNPLPASYLFALLGAIVLLELLPFAEEFLRGLRKARRTG